MRRSESGNDQVETNQINFTKNRNKVHEDQYLEYPKSIFLSPCPDGVSLSKGNSHHQPEFMKEKVPLKVDSVTKIVSLYLC